MLGICRAAAVAGEQYLATRIQRVHAGLGGRGEDIEQGLIAEHGVVDIGGLPDLSACIGL